MKRLFALLLLLVSPALYAQVDFTDAVNVNNVVTSSSFEGCAVNVNAPGCGGWVDVGLGDFSNSFGSTEYVFSYTQGTLYQNINLSNYQTNAFNFYFDFDLNNSCRNSIGGSCTNVDGPIDPFTAKIYFYDQNGLNNEFTFLSGTPSTANIVCNGFDLLGLCLLGYSALDNWQHFGWYSSVQSDTLFTSARIEFTGRDAGFWAGLYGPRVDNATLQINYLPPPYPTFDGGSGMNVAAPGSDYIFIYKGNDPVLFSQLAIKGQDLVGWTAIGTNGQDLTITQVSRPDPDYLFLYTDGVPVSGTFYSFQELPPTVDCTVDPFDPTCVIDTLGIDESPVMVADTTDESLPTEEDPAPVDELFAAADLTDEELDEEMSDEESLEELLDEESDDEETVTEERILVYRELSDEEKAAILADAIAKNTLEAALSIAADATNSGSNAGSSANEGSEGTTSTKNSSAALSVDTTTVAQETSSTQSTGEETKQESVESSSEAFDILENGRQIGAAALASTLAESASSASDSLNEAESIAVTSAEMSSTVADVSEVKIDSTITETTTEVEFGSTNVEMSGMAEETTNVTFVAGNDSNTTTSDQADTFSEIMQLEIKPETGEIKDKDLEFVQQILATTEQKQSDDLSNSTFSEEEKVTIASDPALANAFNLAPNINNLEAAGVLNQKQEEKSDAEKRADEVVAANAKEQEDINKNYMDADQSGIVAAMGADTDVSAYRTAMLRDNNNWYKPEDIYRNIVIKDNVRGSYFLEKGNTDTYKKMVDEQYK